MIGERYWSIGIIVDYNSYGQDWHVKVQFFDNGWCQDQSTQGEIRARYWSKDLSTLLDNVIADAKKLGIEWKPNSKIYAEQDGKDFPSNWKQLLKIQADRIGFGFPYSESETKENV